MSHVLDAMELTAVQCPHEGTPQRCSVARFIPPPFDITVDVLCEKQKSAPRGYPIVESPEERLRADHRLFGSNLCLKNRWHAAAFQGANLRVEAASGLRLRQRWASKWYIEPAFRRSPLLAPSKARFTISSQISPCTTVRLCEIPSYQRLRFSHLRRRLSQTTEPDKIVVVQTVSRRGGSNMLRVLL
jgi:hypothetical protein